MKHNNENNKNLTNYNHKLKIQIILKCKLQKKLKKEGKKGATVGNINKVTKTLVFKHQYA
jgi:hypothetical protein